MHARIAFLVLLFVPSGSAASLQISGFAADLPGSDADDLIVLRNAGASPINLSEYELSDGEGRIGFPPHASLAPQAEVRIAGLASSYAEATGQLPDYALDGLDAAHRMRILKPGFALAQGGDEVALIQGGVNVDRVVYGPAPTGGEGWTGPAVNTTGGSSLRFFGRLGRADTDSAADWNQLSRQILGSDRFSPVASNASWSSGYVAPEMSRAAVELFLRRAARESLRINVYQFRELGLLEPLRNWRAEFPQASLRVLLEPSPVGEGPADLSERAHAIRELRALGAEVHFSSGQRYSYNHAKYVVADESIILVQTENFVPSGLPGDGSSGNRGFGLMLQDAGLGRELARVFDEDFRLEPHGAVEADVDEPRFERPVLAPSASDLGADFTHLGRPAAAWLIVAPHVPDRSTDPILRAIDNATQRIRVAQLNAPPTWQTASGQTIANPYVEALRAAARRGVLVEVLLDGHFVEDEPGRVDNVDTVDLLTTDSRASSIAGRLQRGSKVLHAKMMVVDDQWVLAGSMNWNANAVLNNREVSILLDDPEVARLFGSEFDEDWDAADPDAGIVPAWDATMILAAMAAACALARPRR